MEKQSHKNLLSDDTELLKMIEHQKNYLDWFWALTSEQKNFAVVALIKNLDKEALKKAKRWVRQ